MEVAGVSLLIAVAFSTHRQVQRSYVLLLRPFIVTTSKGKSSPMTRIFRNVLILRNRHILLDRIMIRLQWVISVLAITQCSNAWN